MNDIRSIPLDPEERWKESIDQLAVERNYKNRDEINVTKAGLGDSYESKLKMFFEVRLAYYPTYYLFYRYITAGAHARRRGNPLYPIWQRLF